MTVDEKLAVIAGNLRRCVTDERCASDIAEGNLLELVRIAAETGTDSSALAMARLVVPGGNAVMYAQFCRIYKKYCGGDESPLRSHETAEKPWCIAMPEMERFAAVTDVLGEAGLHFEAEYIDSFSSCCEDVELGNCRYVLLPYSDPAEGRLNSFDKMREWYGLKVHFTIYAADAEGREYGYRLCGLGLHDKTLCAPTAITFTADTKYSPVEYLRGIEVFGATVRHAEFDFADSGIRVRCDTDITELDDVALDGLIMYLGTDTDLTIDGVYAEINHKSRGPQNGLH